MKFRFFLLFFTYFLFIKQSAQIVNFPIQNFSVREYGKDRNSQNICVLQDRLGFMYFGNANGILQYDGKTWQFIPVKAGGYVSSMALDSTGTIFVGSQNEFGYLKANRYGQFNYHSLSSSLKETDKKFSTIIKTYATNNEVVFQSQEKIFIFKKDSSLNVINPATTFHTSFVVNNEIYVRERKTGLLKLSNGLLKSVKGGDLFADMGIFAMLPSNSKGEMLVATMEMGLWKYSPDAANTNEIFTPLKTSNEEFILNSKLYGGIKLSDRNFAFNTLKAGTIIMNSDGQILSVINKEMGLRDNDVKQIFEDAQQNLWMGLNNGISMVSYKSNLSYYSDESGLVGSVHALNKKGVNFYVATSNGLFYKNNFSSSSEKYTRVPGINTQIWCLFKSAGTLVAGGDDGIYILNSSGPIKVSDIKCRSLNYDSINSAWLVGADAGIMILNNKWQLMKTVDEVTAAIINIELAKDSNNNVDIWAGTLTQGIFHITLDESLKTKVKWIGLPDGLTEECTYPFKLDGKIVFGSSTGVYSYSEEGGYKLTPLIDGLVFDRKVNGLYQYKKNIWLSVNNHLVLFNREKGTVIQKPFHPIDKGQLLCFYQDSSILWAGSDDGLIRYDVSDSRDYDRSFNVQIRKVNCGKDSVIFFGNEPLQKNSERSIFNLSYKQNSLYFEYAGLFFEEKNKNWYSFKLEGQDTSWSRWTNETKAVFTNLHEGNYTFRVRSRNVYEAVSKEATYSFKISSPWYRTWWAYISYFLAVAFFVIGFIKNRTKKLIKEKEALEKIVLERTAEISRQKDEIALKKHLVDEQHKEITDSINYAQRIQRALLASTKVLNKNLTDYFIFFKPKDVVSGDFYWAHELSDGTFALVTADSTGHGVPGAIMSMLNISCLNDAAESHKLIQPSEILNHTRKKIINYLSNDGSAEGGKDGMDCSLLKFDFDKKLLIYSAANNPVWIVRNKELIECDPDKMPVGKHDKDFVSFTQHSFDLQKGDVVYALTDGFPDQFGGPKGKKFMSKNLKELLRNNVHLPMSEQKQLLDQTFKNWVGSFEQVDDVTIIGVRI